MTAIRHNVSLKPYNTFGLDCSSSKFASVKDIEDIQTLLQNQQDSPWLILGGGSNILLTQDYKGLVVKIDIKGIDIIQETEDHIYLKVGAGEVWHDFVLYAIKNNYAGIENLSLIPGTVGAAPMQNIGAYGVEVKDFIDRVFTIERASGLEKEFPGSSCEFGYRSSIFKTSQKDKHIITHVVFRLNKKPSFNTTYGAINDTLKEMGITELSIEAISKAVIHIRSSKLPDPKHIGNAGSFFKNPEISKSQFLKLQTAYPEIPHYPTEQEGMIKVPAGWLIEQAGWKGKKLGNYGVHDKQALVLVNHGGAKGKEIQHLSEQIIASVNEKFGVCLIPEVNII